MTKTCPKCKISKPSTLEYFYSDRTKKDGLGYWCKECKNISNKNNPNRLVLDRIRAKKRYPIYRDRHILNSRMRVIKKLENDESIGYLYVISCNGFFKIGRCKTILKSYENSNGKGRLSNLQAGNPFKLSIYREIQVKRYKYYEKLFHMKLIEYQTEAKNEWFNCLEDKIIECISLIDNKDIIS